MQPTAADPVLRELIKNALVTIADTMIVSVVRTSRSIVVKNNLDLSAAVMDAEGQLIAQGLSLPGQLGSMMPALRGCLDAFGDDIHEGDILCSNDPYAGASHLNDLFMYKPIYADGKRIAYIGLVLHHIDMGGQVPGGNLPDAAEIYQEGLRISPTKIVERGVLNATLMRILRSNVRVSDRVVGDIRAQVASLEMAERDFLRVVDEYGVEPLQFYMNDLIDYAEQLMRAGIRSIGDGVGEFVDYLDDNGAGGDPVRLQVKVTITGDHVHFDYSGTSPQTTGSLNPNRDMTIGTSLAVLKILLDPNIPMNAGFYRAISVHVPEGSFLNPKFPAPFGARALGGYRLRMAIAGALAQIAPDRIPACNGGSEFALLYAGNDENERPFVMMDYHNQTGQGGGPFLDGQEGGPYCLGNVANAPVEVLEAEFPIRVERYALRPDSEGAGEYRGSLGIDREYSFLADRALMQLRSDRQIHAPFGLFGGDGGSPGRIFFREADGVERQMPSKFRMNIRSGTGLRAELPGSGGYGDPLRREAERVAEDVRQGKMTAARARDVYGVSLAPDGAPDAAATAKRRSAGQTARAAS